jgi:site-specific recombinase XerD
MNEITLIPTPSGALAYPAPPLIAAVGPAAAKRFVEFFTAHIRNPNTRLAYIRTVVPFFAWCEEHHLALDAIEPVHVAAYIERLTQQYAPPTVKQHLAAIRMLCDYLVVGHVLRFNPATSVRGPRHVVKQGKTPVLTTTEARQLLEAIDVRKIAGLRDRALIGVMIYSFARVSAVVGMEVGDYFQQGKRYFFRLHEKGGKHHVVPVHHKAEEYVDAYLAAAGIAQEKHTPLFRSLDARRQLTSRGLHRINALHMVKRRARQAGLADNISCHTFRATGITAYLECGGTIEKAQQIAAHESPRTTKLYDRTNDQVNLDEIEKIALE